MEQSEVFYSLQRKLNEISEEMFQKKLESKNVLLTRQEIQLLSLGLSAKSAQDNFHRE